MHASIKQELSKLRVIMTVKIHSNELNNINMKDEEYLKYAWTTNVFFSLFRDLKN